MDNRESIEQKKPFLSHPAAKKLFVIAGILFVLVAGLGSIQFFDQKDKSRYVVAAAKVDEARLLGHVKTLSVKLSPRSVENPRNLNMAADYIRDELTSYGIEVTEQSYDVAGQQFRNIVARFGPKDTKVPLLIFGAHYDSHDKTPGADDNASGVAGLLELSRLLQQYPPTRPIEVVAYSTEEPPHFGSENMGSAHHAVLLSKDLKQVDLMIGIEMIGYFSDEPNSQRYPDPTLAKIYPHTGNFIAVVGRIRETFVARDIAKLLRYPSNLPVESFNAPEGFPGLDLSDHRNYWSQGIPAVMVTDTAYMRNKNYHKAGDTFDTLDYKRMSQVVSGLFMVAQFRR